VVLIEARLAFGDSYTYVQGTAGLQNFSFIGDLQNFTFSSKQLFADEIVQNQVCSPHSPKAIRLMANRLEHRPEVPIGSSICQVAVRATRPNAKPNFGTLHLQARMYQLICISTSPVLNKSVNTYSTPLHHPFSVSLQNQIKQWATYALPVLKLDVQKTLVAVWIGINDISDSDSYTFPRNGTTDFPTFYKAIIDTEFQSLETVYDAGYRNFLFMNLPPLDKTVLSPIPTNSPLIQALY
jgi:hypothetical protein